VSGTIVDSSGAVVAGAVVNLLRNGEAQVSSVPSGADGGIYIQQPLSGLVCHYGHSERFSAIGLCEFHAQGE
jgi:hypothetical protein